MSTATSVVPTSVIPEKPFFTIAEIVRLDLLPISQRFLYMLVERGEIRAKRLGAKYLIPRSEVIRLLEFPAEGDTSKG